MTTMFQNINFSTIDLCNRSCSFCPNVHDIRKTGQLMRRHVFLELLNQLQGIDFKGTISPFGNNEPLLDKRIFDWINTIKTQLPNNEILIHTNGDKLFDDVIFDEFCKSKLDYVIINCYDGIERYHAIQQIFGLTADNATNYGHYFKYDKYIEIRITEKLPHFWNRGGSVDVTPTITETYCFIPFKWCTVNHKGDVYLCCSDWRYEKILGNIMDKNILDIWNCEEYNIYREYHLMERGKELPLCDKCNRL